MVIHAFFARTHARICPMNMNTRNFAIVVLAFVALTACTPAERTAERPQGTPTPKLETGIIESNGGGQRALGNTVDVGITPHASRGPGPLI